MSWLWFDKQRRTFARARQACPERHGWSPFPEMPGKYLNPAGNYSLTDLSFVASRLRIAPSRRPAAPFSHPHPEGDPHGHQ